MNTISELLSPSIAMLHICEACNLESGSFWIIRNSSILQFLIRLGLLKPGSQELINYLMFYANIRFLPERTDFIRKMNPMNFLKKWLLNILVPYIEGTNKKKGKDKKWIILFKTIWSKKDISARDKVSINWRVESRK